MILACLCRSKLKKNKTIFAYLKLRVQVGQNYAYVYLFNLRSNICKSWCLNAHFVLNRFYLGKLLIAPCIMNSGRLPFTKYKQNSFD